jgi:tRNA A-37 threonylcarbamoyl transferase component Bud32
MAKICPVCSTEFTDESAFCPSDGSTLRSKESEGDLVGQVIADRYLVQKKLGEGGMGAVYLAKHVRLPKQAAIKVLRPEMLADSASVARFNQEAANASQIEHEGVARVFDYGETSDGTVYLAMEFVPGRSLRDVLDQDGALSLDMTATVIRQVAGGLDAAHRLGIVHRDLKPDNILVSSDEKTGEIRCKVVDFGIAKAVGGAPGQAALTRTGMVVGTPEFMSPEQLLAGELDHRSDVYALALVAYQCLTLDLPFDLKAPDRGMTARLVSQPRRLDAVRPDLPWPQSLQAVFDQGLDRDPDQRTASAGAFAIAFDGAVQDSGNGPTKKGRAKAAAKAAAPAATTAAKTAPASAGAGAAATPAKSGGNGALIGIAAAVLVLGGGGAWWFVGRGSAPAAADTAAVSAATPGADAPAGTPPAGPANGGTVASNATASPAAGPGAVSGAGVSGARGAASAPAGPTPGAPTPTAPTPPAPAASAAPTGGAAAKASLDSIQRVIEAATIGGTNEQIVQVANAAIPAIMALLPRLPSASDSANAFLRAAEAYVGKDDTRSACVALQSAAVLARSMRQAEPIKIYQQQLSCK